MDEYSVPGDTPRSDVELSPSWQREIEKRIVRLRDGTAQVSDWEDVQQRLRATLLDAREKRKRRCDEER